MHWVKATTPDDRDIHINLAAIQHTMRVDGVTIAFLGGVAYNSDGRVQYATTSVKETLEELLARPKLEPGVNVPPSAYTAAAKGIASRTATETVSEIARKASATTAAAQVVPRFKTPKAKGARK